MTSTPGKTGTTQDANSQDTTSQGSASQGTGGSVEKSAARADRGSTQIADVVVQKIAGVAAREVPGVSSLGGGVQRAFSAVRERIPGATTNVAQGVGVEVGESEAAIDLELVVEYGVAIAELVATVRRNTISAVERMCGLRVIEVNVHVADIYLPDEDDGENANEPRVQ